MLRQSSLALEQLRRWSCKIVRRLPARKQQPDWHSAQLL